MLMLGWCLFFFLLLVFLFVCGIFILCLKKPIKCHFVLLEITFKKK